VLTSTCPYPLEPNTEEEQRDWLALRSSTHPVTVAVIEGEVVGWGSVSPWKSRGGYAHTVEASVYVRHDCHRRGLGRAI
ncbi:GNAT family N-acetyltransferase, partial [Salmonella sp. SAL4456]|uniref:GNAT family N-acetyltransferase n=1 Tax=Salmonella sp. SAL4456 TaxID=3159911 RepID=UPI003979166F